MRKDRWVLLGRGAAILAAIAAPAACARFAAADETAKMIAAWRQRQSEVASFRFAFTAVRTIPKGTLAPPPLHRPEAVVVPPQDVVMECAITYAAKGAKLCYREKGQTWDEGTNTGSVSDYACGFDGHESALLFAKGGRRCAIGELWHFETPDDTLVVHQNIIAIALVYRPFELVKRLGVELAHGRLAGDGAGTARPDRETIIFPRGSNGDWTAELTVDPTHNYTPTELALIRLGKTRSDLRIRYGEAPTGGPIPKGWRWMDRDDAGRLVEDRTANVTDGKINCDLPDGMFQVHFPHGAWVNEHDAGGDRVFVVLNDGRRRYLLNAEADMNQYDQIMDPSILARRNVVRWCLFALTVLGAVALLGRWLRHRLRPMPPRALR